MFSILLLCIFLPYQQMEYDAWNHLLNKLTMVRMPIDPIYQNPLSLQIKKNTPQTKQVYSLWSLIHFFVAIQKCKLNYFMQDKSNTRKLIKIFQRKKNTLFSCVSNTQFAHQLEIAKKSMRQIQTFFTFPFDFFTFFITLRNVFVSFSLDTHILAWLFPK